MKHYVQIEALGWLSTTFGVIFFAYPLTHLVKSSDPINSGRGCGRVSLLPSETVILVVVGGGRVSLLPSQ